MVNVAPHYAFTGDGAAVLARAARPAEEPGRPEGRGDHDQRGTVGQ